LHTRPRYHGQCFTACRGDKMQFWGVLLVDRHTATCSRAGAAPSPCIAIQHDGDTPTRTHRPAPSSRADMPPPIPRMLRCGCCRCCCIYRRRRCCCPVALITGPHRPGAASGLHSHHRQPGVLGYGIERGTSPEVMPFLALPAPHPTPRYSPPRCALHGCFFAAAGKWRLANIF